jgi:hypothetical protein
LAGLTKKQRRIVEDLPQLESELGLSPADLIEAGEIGGGLTAALEVARRRLIASGIVQEYTFIDELLGTIIVKYFFGASIGPRAWRTKRFQRFNYYILEKLSLLQKLDLVHAIRALPRDVLDYVQTLNHLRNAMAHSFFAENLRGLRTFYKGQDVLTLEGFLAFRADEEPALRVLVRRAYRVQI